MKNLIKSYSYNVFTAMLLAFALFVQATHTVHAQAPDKSVVFHFTTVGDSREEPALTKLNAQESLWIQNTKVLARMIREMQAVKPQALFFNGDMIMGYTSDRVVLDRQYAYWRGMIAHLIESGTYVVPVPGNHEMQVRSKTPDGKVVRQAMVENENAWRANMGDLIFNQARWQAMTNLSATAWSMDHTPPIGADGVTTDQRQLSYSFDVGAIHFTIMNTDPVGFDNSAPVKWLEADLAAAQQRGAKRFLVFAHKMAFTYTPDKVKVTGKTFADGLDLRPVERDAFWDVIERYQATYFTGHQHVFNAQQPRKEQGGNAWQVIVGSGGTNFSIKKGASDNPYDYYFSWADVRVFSDNSMRIRVLGFDENFGPTRTIAEWDIQ